MTSYLNKQVSVGARRGIVTEEFKNRKGKLRLVIRFDDGSAEEVGYGLVTIREAQGPEIQFAPPATMAEIMADVRREKRELFARMRID